MIATAALREKLVEAYEWPVCDQNGVSRRFIANYCSRCILVIDCGQDSEWLRWVDNLGM